MFNCIELNNILVYIFYSFKRLQDSNVFLIFLNFMSGEDHINKIMAYCFAYIYIFTVRLDG